MKIVIALFLFTLSFTCWGEILTPGDRIFLQIPGEPAFEQPFTINDQGQLLLPEIGPVKVAGLKEPEAEELIFQALSELYRNLDAFKLSVVEQLIRVQVLGYVEKPGAISLQPESNVQMALTKVGGARPGAQLDQFQLQRQGKIQHFNYKSYLDSGDPSLLPILQDGDILFIPASPLLGNIEVDFDAASLINSGDASEQQEGITIFGELRNPGLFSYKKGMTVIDALMRADGVTRFADVSKIRVITDNKPYVFDLKYYLDTSDNSNLPPIKPGTTIFAPIEVEDIGTSKRSIYVMGEVKEAGVFEATSETSFIDALANAGGPTRFADTTNIRLLRTTKPPITINLVTYTKNPQSITLPPLESGDAIFVPEKLDLNEKSWLKVTDDRAIKIIGAVKKPGRYEWSQDMDFMDLLAHAGGPNQQANLSRIRIIKESKTTGHQVQFFDFDGFIKRGSPASLLPDLAAGDSVIIDELPNDPSDNKSSWVRQSAKDSIYIFGSVGAPGRYAFNREQGFLDILSAADGPVAQADLKEVLITHRNGQQRKITRLDLAKYFETGNEKLLPKVLPGDVIYVPPVSSDADDKAVKVMGAVESPGRFKWNSKMTFLDLLAVAGGPTQKANISKIRIIKERSSRTGGNILYFDLERFMDEGGNFNELPKLQAGDSIIIDELPHDPTDNKSTWLRQSAQDSIYIFGAIGAPGRYAFNQQMGFLDILSAADGPTNDADLQNVRISHRNGNHSTVTQLNLTQYFETGDETIIPKVVPGDVIYIPPQDRLWLDKSPQKMVRLMGSVHKPGRYDFNQQMSLLDLLAEAGGPTDKAYIERIMIVNSSCCGDKTQAFNLRDYINDPQKYPLPLLRPGDTVYVPDEGESTSQQIRQAFQDALGIFSLIALGAAL
ncbi:TPA: SLBB domain-containing protein [Photobacterium damselae]